VFVALFSIGWLFAYNFATCVCRGQDGRPRRTAMALFSPACPCSVAGWAQWRWAIYPDRYALRRCSQQGSE
jgi:hypothetical protein